MRTFFVCIIALVSLVGRASAQDGVSSAGAARMKYLGSRGMLPSSKDIIVEDIVNYHRHEIGRPKAGEAVGLDLAWQKEFSAGEPAVLQVGLSTALLNDKSHLRPLNLSLVIDKSGSMADADKMSRVKQALMALLQQLRPADVLSIVEFDTTADLLVPAQPLGDGEVFRAAVQRLQPGSSTNLNDGLMLGYKEALKNKRKGWTNRVVLLTDGIANQGVTNPAEIAAGSQRYNDQGIDLSTIGLGLDLNKDLLERLAKSGRGLFHFVADSQDIDKVFVREVQSLVSPIATDPALELQLDPAIKVSKIFGYSPETKGNRVIFKLGNMNSGMTEVVLLSLSPENREQTVRDLPVKVKISYFDLQKNASVVKTESTLLKVRPGNRSAAANPQVTKNFTIANLAQCIREMAQDCEQQAYGRAKFNLEAVVDQTRAAYPAGQDADVTRVLTTAEQYLLILAEKAGVQAAVANVIPNGDFSLGNTGFTSELGYVPPKTNALWPSAYTVMPQFNAPQLHTLVPAEPYAAPKQRSANEQVLFANAGGTVDLTVWSTTVKCRPNTRYRISFQGISLSGGQEWIATFRIQANGSSSAPQRAPDRTYGEISMIWNSGRTTSATISIIRQGTAHNGGLIGIANVEMVPEPDYGVDG